MEQPDPLIHQPVRLKIMSALRPLLPDARLEFVRLKAVVKATDGNLASHLATLEEAGYVRIEKDFDGKVPRTRVALTRQGRRRYEDYIAFLRTIVEE